MTIRNYMHYKPAIDPSAYVDEAATVIGRVTIGKKSSAWPCSVLRGDINEVRIGDYTNVQDGAVLHVTYELPVILGNGVTVGHLAMIHGAAIGDNSLIGIGAIVLDGATIGRNCVIAAGALIPPRASIPDNSMVMGSPGKVVRQLTPEEKDGIVKNAQSYVEILTHFREIK